jgi:hypothetical protein
MIRSCSFFQATIAGMDLRPRPPVPVCKDSSGSEYIESPDRDDTLSSKHGN